MVMRREILHDGYDALTDEIFIFTEHLTKKIMDEPRQRMRRLSARRAFRNMDWITLCGRNNFSPPSAKGDQLFRKI